MSCQSYPRVHQHLCAFHVVADQHGRQVESHHYCTCVSSDFHQCIVYDSDQPNARLIGSSSLIIPKLVQDIKTQEVKLKPIMMMSYRDRVLDLGSQVQWLARGRKSILAQSQVRG